MKLNLLQPLLTDRVGVLNFDFDSDVALDDHVKQLSEILNALDRYASVEKTYVAAKMQGIKTTVQLPPKAAHVSDAEWEKRVIDDVRDWHDHLVRNISEELEWCRALFPEQCPSLMTAFLTALFKEWNK